MAGRYRLHRLGAGDERVLAILAERNSRFVADGGGESLDPLPPPEAVRFAADDRTVFIVAVEARTNLVAGFVYACVLYRRHSRLRHLCVYEVGVDVDHRTTGVGERLLAGLADEARAMGIDRGFAVTTMSHREAVALYESAGGVHGADRDVVYALRF